MKRKNNTPAVKTNSPGGEVLVYEAPDGNVRVDVRLDHETVWLSQEQIGMLFGRERSVITKHIRNVFKEGELEPAATCAKFAQVQREGGRTVTREMEHYNLDVIISVGYRVKSQRGVRFRQWATRVLRDNLVQGYTLNAQRLAEKGFLEARQAFELMSRTLKQQALVNDEGAAVLEVVQRYLSSFGWLLAYDENRLPASPAAPIAPQTLGLKDARIAIDMLRQELIRRKEATALFGQERGEALAGILGNIEQTFDGAPLYPSAQVRAVHLLYFVIKDHPFTDGNKRIGTLLFLDYLRRNGLLFKSDGAPRFADNAVVALALLIAESAPAQKELLIRLILTMLGDRTI